MIEYLSPTVYQKIKAGEVIEDPSSVVRELLDNAIDAEAKLIQVEIIDGGLESIVIKDNGLGMDVPDLTICFLEHTTSKIKEFEDIFKLNTNGFRGEALASICRIAHVNILSGTSEQDVSHKIQVENGAIKHQTPTAYRRGTIIEVKDLFYNLPVRKKFLKSKMRETSKIKKEILQKALAYPHISFQLISNNKTLINCPANQIHEARMFHLLNIVPPVHPIFFNHPLVNIKGTITGIDQVFDSSSELYVFINNRPLQSKSVYGVMNRALSHLIPKHKYLGGCIYIFTDSKNIDPNIHPAKKEVKIFVEDIMLGGLYNILQSTFYHSHYTTYLDLPTSAPIPTEEVREESTSLFIEPKPRQPSSINFTTEVKGTEEPANRVFYRYIGTFKGTYWLVEYESHILVIDFHAAHERMRYELLKTQWQEKSIEVQPLLTPIVQKLSEKDWDLLDQTEAKWKELGFDFDLLGDFRISLRAVPSILGDEPFQHINQILQELNSSVFEQTDLYDRILKFAACRKSYMANDHVPLIEIDTLIQKILSRSFPLTCPHGRPFTFMLNDKMIESHFLR